MIQIIQEYLPTIISCLVSVLVALSSFICYSISRKIDNARIKDLEERLNQAKSRETYTKCPKCGAKTPLSEVCFYLPSGQLDNNLDGVAD